ncbi:leucine rich repeat (LRR) protein [Fibrobacter sp. UWR4]|nr:leucine rich repeat (LRR) protein [Fibrobacter sp. UWR4]PZW61310.1 leucine rich repeat (LRR) protein [Fibrobacter sp. UWR1]
MKFRGFTKTLSVLAMLLLFSANAFATETVRTTITIDGKEYYLYTGFNAIEGTGYNEALNYEALVDGDMESWCLNVDGGGYVEFSSILPIALKGYVFDSMDPEVNPSSWTLKAKANEEDDWNVVSSRSDDISSGTNFSFACDNQENKAYRYFRFEMEGEYVALSEIRLYGGKEFYFFLPQKSATCTETGIKQACYLGGDGKYFADETGTNELLAEDVIAPIVPHTLEDETAHVSTCTVCGQTIITGPHIFQDENGETRDCICGAINPDHNHGYCGDPEVNDGKDVAWRVTQEEDGNYTLTISGTGRMANFQSNMDEPWNKARQRNYLDKITKAVISDGVTYVGHLAFWNSPGLKTVEIPSSVTAIGNAAFGDCDALTKVKMPCSLDYSSRWWGDERAFVKYHVYEGQPFVDGEDGTHHQNCKCGNTTSTPESHAFTVEDITIDGANESAATCTEKAKYYKSCVCGALSTSEVFEVGEPLGHSWGEYHLDGDQTCSEDGHKTARCTRIGCTEIHTIEATGDALGTTYGAVCAYNDDSKAIIDGNSETSVLLPWNIDVDAIELNRTFAAGTISTITLPFSMYVENVEGAVFYRFKYVSSDDWTVHVGSVRDELIANTPYLVKTTGETISFKTGATLERTLEASPTDQGQDEGDGWELRGTYGKMVWMEGHPDLGYVYGFAAENVADVHIGEFVKATAGANLPPMRAYLYYNPVATPAPSPEPSFRGMAPMARSTTFSIEPPNYLDVVVDDDEGGTLYIGKLNTRTGEFNAAGDRWFDLKGRKLNGKPSAKGSYFNNRSKVIVK